jgi:hypothetical protein
LAGAITAQAVLIPLSSNISGTLVWIPAGVSNRPAFMITKESHTIAIKSLRQEQSLRDHGGAVEVVYVLNPKFPVLIPRTIVTRV